MEMLSSFMGDKHEFCLVVIKFKQLEDSLLDANFPTWQQKLI